MNKKIENIKKTVNSQVEELETSLKKLSVGPKKTVDEIIAFIVKNKKWIIITGIVYLIGEFLLGDPKDESTTTTTETVKDDEENLEF